MQQVFVLARTTEDGKLWQALHVVSSGTWSWRYATVSADHILGCVVLTVANESALPINAGQVTAAMLPGASGEGVTRP